MNPCIYCDAHEYEYIRTIWDTDLGENVEEWRCKGCGAVHGEYIGVESASDDEWPDDGEYTDRPFGHYGYP